MSDAGKRTAAAVLICWMLLVIFFIVLNGHLNLEVFFVLALIGLLILTEFTDTRFSQPRYMRRLRVIIAAGVALFGWIVIIKILEIITA